MRRAIQLSEESVSKGGGPFGAVIVKDGHVIAEASNSVTTTQLRTRRSMPSVWLHDCLKHST